MVTLVTVTAGVFLTLHFTSGLKMDTKLTYPKTDSQAPNPLCWSATGRWIMNHIRSPLTLASSPENTTANPKTAIAATKPQFWRFMDEFKSKRIKKNGYLI